MLDPVGGGQAAPNGRPRPLQVALTVLGIVIGLFLGAMTTVALKDQGFTLQVPVIPLLIFLVVAAIAGVVAAIPPARRASRLDVLQALAYE